MTTIAMSRRTPLPLVSRCHLPKVLATTALVVAGASAGSGVGAAPSGVARGPAPQQGVRGAAPASSGVTDAAEPSISADGRWVVFEGTIGERRTLFRTDRFKGETIELSPLPVGARDGDTAHPRISADGCVVAAVTQLPFDLFRDNDRGERWDVYRLVVPECDGQPNGWELVSTADRSGVARDDVLIENPPTLNGSGSLIAFEHPAPDAPDGVTTITIVDITVAVNEPGRLQRVAGMPAEAPGGGYHYRGARQPALSQNGRHLAFVSDTTANEALPGWGLGPELGGLATSQVFVWDRVAPDQRRAVRLVSARDGAPSVTGGDDPDISEDGRIVVFTSTDRTLVTADLPNCSTACPSQVYRFDRDTDRNGIFDEPPRKPPLALVSAVDAGVVTIGVPIGGNAASWSPAVNADGSQIAFVTDATNLVPGRRGGGGGLDSGDLLVAEFQLGHLRRVLDGADVTSVPGAHRAPVLSSTGAVIAFETRAAAAFDGAPADAAERGSAVFTTAVTPQLSLASIDFGTVLVPYESTEISATVRNAGPAAFEASSVETSSPSFRVQSGGTCQAGVIVAAGTSCSVKVTFTPAARGPAEATLTVRGVGPGAASVSASLRGSGGEPMLLPYPGGKDFPTTIVGEAGGLRAIDIGNIGFLPTEIVELSIGGTHAGDFAIVTESCLDRALNPDAKCAVSIEFHPTGSGYRTALLIARTAPVAALDGPPAPSYTAALLGGLARYAPTFVRAGEDPIRPGSTFGVGGFGFPVGAEVTIGFDDGSASFATVTTRDDGTFLAQITMPVRVRVGPRTLIATSSGGAIATLDIVVARRVDRAVPALPGYGTG